MNSIMREVHEAQHTLPYNNNDHLIKMQQSKILNTTCILPKLPPPPPPPPPPSSSLPPNSNPQLHHQPSSRILCFENATPNVMDHEYSPTYLNSIFSSTVEAEVPITCGTKRTQPLSRNQSVAQDHIIAERKRRGKLAERFAALSALIPGLKKMHKASVLGDAANHIKYLQERVKEFEEEKKERRLESMVLVKKPKLIILDNSSQSSSSSSSSTWEDGLSGLDLPEVEVRFSDKDVLIKILCEKQKGYIAKIMAEIEKCRFSITTSSVLLFGPIIDITIAAQKDSDFDMTLMDVVKSLRSALSKFM